MNQSYLLFVVGPYSPKTTLSRSIYLYIIKCELIRFVYFIQLLINLTHQQEDLWLPRQHQLQILQLLQGSLELLQLDQTVSLLELVHTILRIDLLTRLVVLQRLLMVPLGSLTIQFKNNTNAMPRKQKITEFLGFT